jgi:hypothetical protein
VSIRPAARRADRFVTSIEGTKVVDSAFVLFRVREIRNRRFAASPTPFQRRRRNPVSVVTRVQVYPKKMA